VDVDHDDLRSDDALMSELAGALGPELEPPAAVLQAARSSLTWRTVDAELAALSSDSLLDGERVGSRSAATSRTLTFDSPEAVIEVEVSGSAGDRRLVGQLDPPEAARLELRTTGEPVTGSADELGRFVLALPAERQLCSLRCLLAGGVVQTSWMVL
jgi:hypothetical protein